MKPKPQVYLIEDQFPCRGNVGTCGLIDPNGDQLGGWSSYVAAYMKSLPLDIPESINVVSNTA